MLDNVLDYLIKVLVYPEVLMPVIPPASAVAHEVHGSTFRSYVTSDRGAAMLRAWQLEVGAGSQGVAHRPTREEVMLVLTGSFTATVDGDAHTLGAGDVLLVPANSELAIDGGPNGAIAWVTTTIGLVAVLADGTRMSPPWAA